MLVTFGLFGRPSFVDSPSFESRRESAEMPAHAPHTIRFDVPDYEESYQVAAHLGRVAGIAQLRVSIPLEPEMMVRAIAYPSLGCDSLYYPTAKYRFRSRPEGLPGSSKSIKRDRMRARNPSGPVSRHRRGAKSSRSTGTRYVDSPRYSEGRNHKNPGTPVSKRRNSRI